MKQENCHISNENFYDCGGKYCSFDSDCNIKNFCCPKTRRCIQIGIFDPCESSNQCPENSKCHPAIFRCYPRAANVPSTHEEILEWNVVDGKKCRMDYHCHRDSYCNKNGECVPLPLLSQSCTASGGKCKRPFICSPRDKTCRMPCWSNFDCQQNYKWWKEASPFFIADEGKLMTFHKRLDLVGSSTSGSMFPMEEGNQGYCCNNGINDKDILPSLNGCDSIEYDWCNSEGYYCDIAPGSTNFKVISFALIPLALIIGIVFFCRMLKSQSSKNNRIENIDFSDSINDTTHPTNTKTPKL